ncbi:MAG: hypothetical protein A2Y28_04190 [Chlamydiae bacterium GWC2_50_10]|nr:MAG: hypothetical protein A2Z85_04240 [Chlamydiae bacterium GWA2_50_15]OGN53706.1 MAG: hypothetical protein A2Y28_04190 [Chlamydiae bacterium GWC2_50_10]OGN58204.1 MAG: hypothetical protein A3D18_02170 [Chlamydiae bacterium RIFCSPHIGHO2_02_FULL_49_29]OGN62364.1 MAG: hypothetical protein A3E26_01690 [Chlamydiae bacterium RIFCSPHIGHO2_12_FULL_49_32]OGN71568.1 MAG: hypothetical protein A3I15_05855 [Chlamydiae bacterium RIFCSPLOWO2_02_FULL_49_12]HAZ15528.1 DNA-3-methyladenine glycosylase [Parac
METLVHTPSPPPLTLPLSFYQGEDVVAIAKALLGKWLLTRIGDDPVTGGMIIETEAYAGAEDRASHAYNNRRTARTETLFGEGGVSYIYFCYGMHHLFNVVTHRKETPHAVLIRSLHPTTGLKTMQRRRRKEPLTKGPGNLSQALGLTLIHNALPLNAPPLWIEDREVEIPPSKIQASERIGVAYAKEDALLPYRFSIIGSCCKISNELGP